MTEFEKKQPRSVFINGGKNSFHLGILPGNCPFTLSPYKEWWSRGYQEAQDKFFGTTQRRNPFLKPLPQVGRGNRKVTERPARVERPALSLGKISNFNRRHQTQPA